MPLKTKLMQTQTNNPKQLPKKQTPQRTKMKTGSLFTRPWWPTSVFNAPNQGPYTWDFGGGTDWTMPRFNAQYGLPDFLSPFLALFRVTWLQRSIPANKRKDL